MNTSIILKQAETKEELEQIIELQTKNHASRLTPEEKKENGFLNVRHDLGLLTEMNKSAQQIIAKYKDEVVGYALVMLKEHKEMIPMLTPMFEMFNHLSFEQRLLTDYKFYVMGQICVSETYRGQGIFEALYLKHKEIYSNNFEIFIN